MAEDVRDRLVETSITEHIKEGIIDYAKKYGLDGMKIIDKYSCEIIDKAKELSKKFLNGPMTFDELEDEEMEYIFEILKKEREARGLDVSRA